MAATYDIHWRDVDLDGCDRICIDHRENICSVCAKPYPHHKRYFWGDDKTIKDVELITAHAGCRSLLSKIEEQKTETFRFRIQIVYFKN